MQRLSHEGHLLTASPVIITLVATFEIGSIVCATAPSSNALIVGRVITGIGGAGITSGALTLINLLVPLQYRPQWTGTSKSFSCFITITQPRF